MKPDRHYEHKQYAFDSYCKKVLKCEACYRQIKNRKNCPRQKWPSLRSTRDDLPCGRLIDSEALLGLSQDYHER